MFRCVLIVFQRYRLRKFSALKTDNECIMEKLQCSMSHASVYVTVCVILVYHRNYQVYSVLESLVCQQENLFDLLPIFQDEVFSIIRIKPPFNHRFQFLPQFWILTQAFYPQSNQKSSSGSLNFELVVLDERKL